MCHDIACPCFFIHASFLQKRDTDKQQLNWKKRKKTSIFINDNRNHNVPVGSGLRFRYIIEHFSHRSVSRVSTLAPDVLIQFIGDN